jgi:hypothetical protein
MVRRQVAKLPSPLLLMPSHCRLPHHAAATAVTACLVVILLLRRREQQQQAAAGNCTPLSTTKMTKTMTATYPSSASIPNTRKSATHTSAPRNWQSTVVTRQQMITTRCPTCSFFEDINDGNDGGNGNDDGGNSCKGGRHGNKLTRYRGKGKVGDTWQST